MGAATWTTYCNSTENTFSKWTRLLQGSKGQVSITKFYMRRVRGRRKGERQVHVCGVCRPRRRERWGRGRQAVREAPAGHTSRWTGGSWPIWGAWGGEKLGKTRWSQQSVKVRWKNMNLIPQGQGSTRIWWWCTTNRTPKGRKGVQGECSRMRADVPETLLCFVLVWTLRTNGGYVWDTLQGDGGYEAWRGGS